MNMYLTGTIISALVIGLSTLSLEALFARYAKIDRSSLSAVVCPLIAFIVAGLVDGFMSGGDFVAAYFNYLSGLGIIWLIMLMFDALRSWWRRFRQERSYSVNW
jgi:hypothetical protein